MTEFDKALVFTDLYTCNRLNAWAPDQYSGIEISVKDLNRVDEVSGALIKLVNRKTDAYGGSYVTMTIQELYPQIFAWLSLLDVNVWVIFGSDGICSRVYDEFPVCSLLYWNVLTLSES